MIGKVAHAFKPAYSKAFAVSESASGGKALCYRKGKQFNAVHHNLPKKIIPPL